MLQGPFLTRTEAARALGIRKSEVVLRPELLRVTGLLEECYFEFQCRSERVSRDLGRLVLSLRGSADDLTIADWLVRQNLQLKEVSPLVWIEQGWGLGPVLRAAANASTRSEHQVRLSVA